MAYRCVRVPLSADQAAAAVREFSSYHRKVRFVAYECEECLNWHVVKQLKPSAWGEVKKRGTGKK
jgi:hypothetical protein